MKSDIEIAQMCTKKNISDVARKIGLTEDDIELYGKYKAKIDCSHITQERKGKLILVTSINPTPYGEGKTTMSIGLGDGLNLIGKSEITVLREPSLGPVFGIKGGATGGGYAQVIPMEDINLHFTGDMHAITSANNLIASAIDNHIYFGNELGIDTGNILFKRCMDLNDRALRRVEILDPKTNRYDYFNITAACEIMSVLCLSKDLFDLRNNIGNILIGYTKDERPIFVRDLKVEGSCAVLLKDAIKPNLVQTLEGNPAIIHGGPFANIAHGCNTIIATDLGLKLADYVVTEAGFGSDLGAEKFMDIKCRKADMKPDCVVLVATLKALKYNAGVSKEDILIPSVDKVKEGLPNLLVHMTNMLKYTKKLVICLNKYGTDTEEEIAIVKELCNEYNVAFVVSDSFVNGGRGSIELANKVVDICEQENDFKFLYDVNQKIVDKISIIAKEIYHAGEIKYTEDAIKKIQEINNLGLSNLPVCIAKTQYSISDDPTKLGYPKNYEITVRDVLLYNGSGFITVLLGNMLTMPGLPKSPNYERIDLDNEQNIVGLF